ncbi:glycosyltransferase 25 family member-like [Haemaphysalis longicornis]
MLPEYADPYHNRPITAGEIGCFMSHYNIWKDMIENQHRIAIIFEDDIRFEPYFRTKVAALLTEVRHLDWDLIYLGRKRLSGSKEPLVSGSSLLVHVDYSYWTLCYALTLSGARKLVDADPLHRMVPVDEYLPIMFDKHPEKTWAAHFPQRDLKAFSAHPLLVYPTHYTGEEHYISDTEDSVIVETAAELGATDSDRAATTALPPTDVASEPVVTREEL